MRGLLLALLAAAPAAAGPDRTVRLFSFRKAEHSLSMPLLEAWEAFLRAEKAPPPAVRNVPARSDGERYEFDAAEPFVGAAEVLETAGGFLALLPPDAALLERFAEFAQRPEAYADRRPPRQRRRRVRFASGRPGGTALEMAIPDADVPRAPVPSDCVAMVYELPGRKAVFIHRTRGGLGRVAAAVERLRERYQNDLLVVSRGDAAHNGALAPAQAAAALDRIGVRAVVPGAAEFARLGELAAADPRLLAANVRAAEGAPALPGRMVLEAGGLRVGLFGLAQEAFERSLSAEDARRYSVTDPLSAARDAAAALRKEADLVVALSNLTPAQNARLRQRVPGIDAVVGDTLPSDPDSELETVSAEDPERGPEDAALIVTADAPAVVTQLVLRRRDLGGGRYSLSAREERLLLDESLPDLPGYAPFHFEAYGVDAGTGPALLPAARRLYAPGAAGTPPRLKDLDFWRLAASLAAESARAEAAFLPVQPVLERTTGDLPEGVVRSWFPAPDRLSAVQLPGSALKALLADARRLEAPDADLPPGGLRLAAGGIGAGNTVHGVPIDERSAYRVVLTERLLAQEEQFPMVARAEQRRPLGRLDESVLGDLRRAAAEGWEPARYRTLLEGRPVRERGFWRVHFRDVGVNVSNTKVVRDPALAGASNARARAFDELLIGGVAKTDLERLSGAVKWTSGLELEYARSRLRPPGQPDVLSTPKNRADARTSVAVKTGRFPAAWLARSYGPSLGAEYEGELERLPLTRRKHKASVLPGVELFNGTLFRSVGLAANVQRDFTPPTPVNQYGARLRALLSAPLGQAQLAGELETKYFFLTSHDTAQDLRLELNAVVKLHVPFFQRFTLAPFFDFLYFQHKVTPADGYSAITGLSLGFSRLWKPQYEPF